MRPKRARTAGGTKDDDLVSQILENDIDRPMRVGALERESAIEPGIAGLHLLRIVGAVVAEKVSGRGVDIRLRDEMISVRQIGRV